MISGRLEQHSGTPGTEGVRRTTDVTGEETNKQDVEVVGKRTRRRLSIGYKLRVLKAIAELKKNESSEGTNPKGTGDSIGSYLRKEGLYYSSVRKWMEQQERGELTGKRDGGKTKSRSALQAEIQKLRRQLEQTEKKLKKTELIIEFQKKISMMLGIDQPEIDEKKLGK
jgi:transposase-like protein